MDRRGKSGTLQEGFQFLYNMIDFKPLGENWLSNTESSVTVQPWVVSATTLLIGEQIREV